MRRPFTRQFLARIITDLRRSSIDRYLIDRVEETHRGEPTWGSCVDVEVEDHRMTWACIAGVTAFTDTADENAVPPTRKRYPDLDGFCQMAPSILMPQKSALIVSTTEAELVGVRDEALLQKRTKERMLTLMRSVEALLDAALERNYLGAADAFYDFGYRYCRDVALLTQWALRLVEVV